ncbi:MAG TPA: hypothetical protein VEW68_06505 [Patescibacteria group bacterium]|nr:hypothetical protein [Patescibacteria group bacterium]
MIRLDIPDGSDEEALEAFLASLNKSARDGVRRMILEGAPEADVAAYIESFEDQLGEEAEAIYEEDETGHG